MKKTYLQPATELVLVQATTILAGSGETMTVYGDDTDGVSDNDLVLSRQGRSVWDDEE